MCIVELVGTSLRPKKQKVLPPKLDVIPDTVIANYTLRNYDAIIGIDPGYKCIAACTKVHSIDGSEDNLIVKSTVFRATTNWYNRQRKQKAITGAVFKNKNILKLRLN